ncbi:Ethanolamine-phosphate cytidylyltransferase [Podila horticola]|nr:Ethanolamine-phosphate cytidylyltransferase [Podila horticola]
MTDLAPSIVVSTEQERRELYKHQQGQPLRIWVDGCYDVMHYGHYNTLRQARDMGGVIIAGIHSDAEITNHKGPSVMNETERVAAVTAHRWVDELVLDAPYQTSFDWINRYHCAICVHGNDAPTLADGIDPFALVKKAGRYRECERTASPEVDENVIYADGDFDLFHIGHTEILKRAKQDLGKYVVVGIHDDATVNAAKGFNFPLMNLYERVLLFCHFVDKVVNGAAYSLDRSILDNVNFIVHSPSHSLRAVSSEYKLDRYQLAKECGFFTEIKNEESLVTTI